MHSLFGPLGVLPDVLQEGIQGRCCVCNGIRWVPRWEPEVIATAEDR